MIETHGVTKVYADGKVQALDGVDLSVGAGEFVAITGPSGCGKSTLLSLLAALDLPTSGTIRVGSYDLQHLHNADLFRRQEVGLVFQLHNLLPRLSVVGNVEIAMMGSERPRAERAKRAQSLLRDVGLADLLDRRPPQLSGGERQRVAVARALANDPSVLYADEPTGSLDSRSVSTILGLFEKLRTDRGVTIVLVTHDVAVAATADRTIHMLDGRIVVPSLLAP
ncbi:MAG TPA: ABC transporter ATP-binding protein [Acidimicrobiales bacterium]|nr:ABC transporter ATP-binding protein [Acidimicrobiales bacterium]